ncbi:MAG: metallophosphoesterase family protein, partial [Clostridia bacterium]|nr:metallophosphoesterase family protein [Clostridia bacterium]
MKIAVISDVHGNLSALNAVLQDIEKQNITNIFFLGDLVMNGPSPWEVFEVIDALSPEVWIKGNTDEWLENYVENAEPEDEHTKLIIERNNYAKGRLSEKQIEKLRNLQQQSTVIINDKKILCVHGSPSSMDESIGMMNSLDYFGELFDNNTFDLILCGHTHLPFIGFYKGKKIMNPGAIGFSLDEDPRASYGILTIGNNEFSLTIQRVAYE